MNRLAQTSPRPDNPLWLVVLMTGLAFGLRVVGLGRQSLWYDEAFSLAVAGTDWPTFWAALLSDAVHPPGYYLLLRAGLILFGSSEFALRFLSVVAGVLAVPLIYQLGCSLGWRRWGIIAGLLLAVNPFAWWYAQEARMYSLLLCLTIAGSYTFWQLVTRPSRSAWLGLTLMSAAGFVIHYFAFVVSLAQFAYLVIYLRQAPRTLRWWTLAQAVAFIPFLPWAGVVAFREGRNFGIGWIHPPTLLDLPLTLSNLALLLSDPASPWTWLGLALVMAAVGSGTISLWRSQNQKSGDKQAGCSRDSSLRSAPFRMTFICPTAVTFLWLWLLLPVVFIWLISLRLPLYVDRQFIIVLPALILLLSAVALLPQRASRGAGVILTLACLSAGGRIWLDPALTKEDWRSAAAIVEQGELPNDTLLLRDLQTGIPFGYYYRGQAQRQTLSINRDTSAPETLIAGYKRAWFIYRRPFEPTHEVAGAPPFTWQDEAEPVVRAWLTAHQAELKQEISLPGVYILLYENSVTFGPTD